MTPSRKSLIFAIALTAGGTLAFLAFLAFTGDADDGHALGLLDWIVGGALIGPGFGYLLTARQNQDR